MTGMLFMLWACETVQAPAKSIESNPLTQEEVSRTPLAQTSVELPPPARDLNRATGSRVQFQNVEGYLARRSDETGSIAFILQGDSLSPKDQHRARQLADSPAVVFLISPDVDANAARVYVEGMPGVTDVQFMAIETEASGTP